MDTTDQRNMWKVAMAADPATGREHRRRTVDEVMQEVAREEGVLKPPALAGVGGLTP